MGAILALGAPASASAETLCVNKQGSQCNQTFGAGELKAAIAKANENQSSFDRIEIGPGLYDTGPYNASSNVDIVGAGRDLTVITNVTPTALDSSVFLANFPDQTVSDLTVRIGPGESSRGLQVGSGALVERVRIEAGPGSDPGSGLDAFGATVREVVVQLPREQFVTAALGAGTIEDSTFEGGTGLFLGGGVARRVVAIGNTAMRARGARIENSVLRAFGPSDAEGLAVLPFDGGEVVLSHVTVAGDASVNSIGLKAEKTNGAFAALTSILTVRNTVVSGFASALTHRGHTGSGTSSCGTNCQITQITNVSYSALDPGRVANLGGPGSLNLGAGNVGADDPRFATGAEGDFRPRFDSPLIDAGEPLPLGSGTFYSGESPVDIGGLERIVDGRPGGDPAARRDIGAHEYARRPPSLTVHAPRRALLYRPVKIPFEASDPDPFDVLSPTFAYDGRETAKETHRFTTLGKHSARVTVTDPTGAAATATTTFPVKARPGPCANRRSGGRKRDVFRGTRAGETLKGGGGSDTIAGRGGADCLQGGKGGDRLNGGKGKDRIGGGAGGDRITSRDGQRDRVDCGPGQDVAVANAEDLLRNCEVARRD